MTLDQFIELARIFVWPLVLIGVWFFSAGEIKSLISRVSELAFAGGRVKLFPAPEQTTANAKAATEALKSPSKRTEPTLALPPTKTTPVHVPASVLHAQVEEAIRKDDKLENLSPDRQIEVLIQHQAAVQIEVVCERLYRLIFGSQIKALREANQQGGTPMTAIRAIFETARAEFPQVHSDRTFEQWAGFLQQSGLGIELPKVNGIQMAATTPLGQEFLRYLIRMGYRDPLG